MSVPLASRLVWCGLSLFLLVIAPRETAAQPVETALAGVTAELIELRQQSGVLRLAVRLVNPSANSVTAGSMELAKFVLVDAKSKTNHFPLKGADGNFIGGPTSNWSGGGTWYVKVPAKREIILWAFFEPLPAGTIVSVKLPLMFPFDDVKITEGPGTPLSRTAATSEISGIIATLVSARRADQQLTIRLRLAVKEYGNDHVWYKDVFLFDPVTKKKYPVLRDASGRFQGDPVAYPTDGGGFYLSPMQPVTAVLVSMTLQAPPDTVVTGDLIVPGFVPIERLAIVGNGGAAATGAAAAGASIGLEGALKELNAAVTPAGIAVNLSADVLFDFDKADLKAGAEKSLQNLLTVVTGKSAAVVSIVGHTDIRGDAEYNTALSERRANAVKAWLVGHGVPDTRVTASGAGKSRPLKPGDTEDAHRANRRVEISLKG